MKRTGAGGVRLKESVGINQGLLSLGKVIRAPDPNPTLILILASYPDPNPRYLTLRARH